MQGDVPHYQELPRAQHGGRSGWQALGAASKSIGRIGLQDRETVLAAAQLVRTGAVYSLNAPHTFLNPPLFARGQVRHTLLGRSSALGYDDVYDNYYPQASSQWDSLAHVAAAQDIFYQGATANQVADEHVITIEHWAQRGIVGRGVLLDLSDVLRGRDSAYNPASSYAFSVDELEQARRHARLEYSFGDIILIHTGFLDWYQRQPEAVRATIAAKDRLTAAGIEHTEAMAEYVWNSGASAFVSDAPALEVWPPDRTPGASPFGYLHRVLIGQFGLAVGELWWLADLADACRNDNRYEFLVTSAPLNMPGGAGSPANALAIK